MVTKYHIKLHIKNPYQTYYQKPNSISNSSPHNTDLNQIQSYHKRSSTFHYIGVWATV